MIIPSRLLPPESSTVWEKVMADVMDGSAILTPQIDLIRGAKLRSPPPSLLPFLIAEYGLGELTPYVPNLYTLIAEGIQWQRVRGTPRAMQIGLGWLGYTAIIEEADKRWNFWNTFQLELNRVRTARADLERIGGIAELSVPVRSKFWRGFHGYDARPMVWGMGSWGNGTWGEYSGIRVRANGPLWSFGRRYVFDTTIARQDLELINAWIEPDWTQYDSELGWGEFTWESTESTWQSGTSATHASAMASGLFSRSVWISFMEANGTIIGYRKARAYHRVGSATGGAYPVGDLRYSPVDQASPTLYIEALTGFGDGDTRRARYVGLCFGAASPGRTWATPAQMTVVSPPVAVKDVDITMGESVREQVVFLLRLDGAYAPPNALTRLGSTPVGVEVDFSDDSFAERY